MSDGFGLDHLPYGVFSHRAGPRRVGVRFEDTVLDLYDVLGDEVFATGSLNAFLARGRASWDTTRADLQQRITGSRRGSTNERGIPLGEVTLHLPFEVGDYVDFYCSLDHATNVGRIFRPDGEALTPNWKHLPIGYHGRSGTVVVSGTDVIRPCGQRLPAGTSTASGGPTPEYGPTRRLDIEAELGFVIGTGSELGSRIGVDDFADHVFGVVGLNDWSARDIQAWEYVPLGPFLGKSFATSVSAWVTPLAALEQAWVDLPGQDPAPLPYLVSGMVSTLRDGSSLASSGQAKSRGGDSGGGSGRLKGLDIDVEVVLNGEVVSRPPYASMYWSPAQMLAHMTVNGASTRTGDLFASGTISGPERDQRGSFLELTWGGREPFGDGRTFLEDGDEVVLRYSAASPSGSRITLGEVSGRILPAR